MYKSITEGINGEYIISDFLIIGQLIHMIVTIDLDIPKITTLISHLSTHEKEFIIV